MTLFKDGAVVQSLDLGSAGFFYPLSQNTFLDTQLATLFR
jgi:hypothetical protein